MNLECSTPELFVAISDAQGELQNAEKNSVNPHFRSRYADLAQVLNTIRPVFAKHGLSLIQSPGFDGTLASVTTVLAHKSGGFFKATASCVPKKTDPQGIGDATTYLRRYSAASFAGISQEDDDGESNRQEPVKTPEPKPAVGETVWGNEFIVSREEKPYKSKDGTFKAAWVYITASGKTCGTTNPEVDALVATQVSDVGGSQFPLDLHVKPVNKGKSFELMQLETADDITP